MTLTVRSVDRSDAAATAALINPLIEAGVYTALTERLTKETQSEFINALPLSSVCYVAIDEATGELVGMQDVLPVEDQAAIRPRIGSISTFVAGRCHRSGVGSALFRETLLECQRLGFDKILAVVRSDNRVAQGFYRSLGFIETPTAEARPGTEDTSVSTMTLGRWVAS